MYKSEQNRDFVITEKTLLLVIKDIAQSGEFFQFNFLSIKIIIVLSVLDLGGLDSYVNNKKGITQEEIQTKLSVSLIYDKYILF